MKRAQKESIIHISLLLLIQWISLAIVILNTYILKSSDSNKQNADYILLILGAISFLVSTVILVFHLHIYFRLSDVFRPPRPLLLAEIILALILVILWALVTALILTCLKGLFSSFKFTMSIKSDNHTDFCELSDTVIILAFVNIGGWILDFFATFLLLLRPSITSTTIFTIEAPPQRFSHPLITPLDNVFQQNYNRVSPDINNSNSKSFPQLFVTSPSTKSENSNEEDSLNHSKSISLEQEKHAEGEEEMELNHRLSSLYPDQHLLHPDSYLTVGTIKPILLELPNIQQGISQIDISFID